MFHVEFQPMDSESARAIVLWRYPPPYTCYNTPAERTAFVALEMTKPEQRFYAAHIGAQLVGFCSFGSDGQIPGGPYDDSATDVGAGLHPLWTGRGHGASFLRAITAFARHTLQLGPLRVTVAENNPRALRAAINAGFSEIDILDA